MEKNLNKYERIVKVKNLNINTQTCILISATEDYKKNSSIRQFIARYKNFSVRTFYNEKIGHSVEPHYPYIKRKYIHNIIRKMQSLNLNIIIANGINPNWTIFCGAVLIENGKATIELCYGQHTVRRVTHDGKIDKRIEVNVFDDDDTTFDKILDNLVDIIRLHIKHLNNSIIEFSYLHRRVGTQKKRLIIWEITKK